MKKSNVPFVNEVEDFNEAVTNLATSNEPAIIITSNEAPANNLLKPLTEQKAAEALTDRAEIAIIKGNVPLLNTVVNFLIGKELSQIGSKVCK